MVFFYGFLRISRDFSLVFVLLGISKVYIRFSWQFPWFSWEFSMLYHWKFLGCFQCVRRFPRFFLPIGCFGYHDPELLKKGQGWQRFINEIFHLQVLQKNIQSFGGPGRNPKELPSCRSVTIVTHLLSQCHHTQSHLRLPRLRSWTLSHAKRWVACGCVLSF